MNFTISIDHEKKIVCYKHTGKIKIQNLGMAWDQILQLEEFTSKKYNLLSDYRQATFDMEIDQVQEIIDILQEMGPVLHGKKQSIIVTDPYSTAGSILFEQLSMQELEFKIKIFSTKKAAIEWLQL